VADREGTEPNDNHPTAGETGDAPRQATGDGAPRADILLVDDRAENLRLLSKMLSDAGYRVRPVTSGSQALLAAQSSPPDLILLDIVMPEMDGYQVCEQLKAHEGTRDIPVLFISALGMTEAKVKAFTRGGVDYITKPFEIEEVLSRVATHLTLRRLQNQIEAANRDLARANAELQARNADLQDALDTIQTLSGLIPICAWCGRKIEDEAGKWVTVERYVETHSAATFTHGMCPDCMERMRAEAERTRHDRSRFGVGRR